MLIGQMLDCNSPTKAPCWLLTSTLPSSTFVRQGQKWLSSRASTPDGMLRAQSTDKRSYDLLTDLAESLPRFRHARAPDGVGVSFVPWIGWIQPRLGPAAWLKRAGPFSSNQEAVSQGSGLDTERMSWQSLQPCASPNGACAYSQIR